MRTPLSLIVIALLSMNVHAQNPGADYSRSAALFDENVRDSSLFYAQRAVEGFDHAGKPDSALLAAVMVSKNQAILSTLDVAAKAISDGLKQFGGRLAKNHPAYLSGLAQRAEVFSSNYEQDSALHYYKMVLDRLNWDSTPTTLHVKVLTNTGFSHVRRREYPQAEEYAVRALHTARKVYGPDAKELTPVAHMMCIINTHTSQYDTALVYAREMLRLNLLNYPEGHPNIGIAHNELGTVFQNLCQYDSAVVHRKACEENFFQNYLKEGQGRYLSVAYGNLGYLYWVMEEHDLALEYNVKGMKLAEEQYGKNALALIFDLVSISNDYDGLGQPEKGLPYLWRAYQIQRTAGADEWGSIAYVENFLASTHNQLMNYDSSKIYAQRAIDHYARAQMGDNKISVNALYYMGMALYHLGDTLEGIQYLRDAERRFESFNVPWHENVINVKVFRSKAARYYGVDSAQHVLNNSFRSASLAKTCAAIDCILDSLFISAQALSIFQAQIELIPLKHPGDPVAAADEYDLWVDRYEKTTAQYLGQLRSGSGIRLVASTNETVFDAGVNMHYKAWLQSGNAIHLDRMLTYSTKGKALSLRLRSNNRKVRNYANVPDALLVEEQAYVTEVEVRRQKMLQDSSLESRIAYSDALEEYQVFKSRLREEHPRYYALKYDLGVPSLETLQNRLKPTERYVEFALVDTTLFALLIQRDAVEVRTFSANAIRPLVTAYAASVQSRDHAIHQSASKALLTAIVQDMLPDEAINKLIIGPDDFLYGVSFESVWLEKPGQYLIERYVVSYAPSADAWIDQASAPGPGKKRILDFTPGFEKTLKERYLEHRDSNAIDSNYLALLSQPFMLMLSEALAKDLGSSSFRGANATESSYKENAGSYQLLHLGTHATLDNANPLYSRLVLAKDSLGDEDGYLYTYEIYGIPVQAELAVLTACETGGGEFQSGQGIESLAHAFAYAGCPSMVMSLWSIDEKSTAEIMQLFYQHIKDDPSVSVALANAKREYLASAPHELRHPYYWSGLVLMGSDGVVHLGGGYRWWLWGAGILMLILITRWFVLRRNRQVSDQKQ